MNRRARVGAGTVARIAGYAAIVAVLLPAAPCAAQFDPSSLEGLRVRVTAPMVVRDPIEGTVLRVSGDTLVVARGAAVDRVGGPVPVPFAAIDRLDLSDGTAPNRPRGAAIGAGIGLGLALALIIANGPRDMPGSVLVGGAGVIGGGITGLLVAGAVPAERWTELPPQLWRSAARAVPGSSLGPAAERRLVLAFRLPL